MFLTHSAGHPWRQVQTNRIHLVAFNAYTQSKVDGLVVRCEMTQDLVVNLFKGAFPNNPTRPRNSIGPFLTMTYF